MRAWDLCVCGCGQGWQQGDGGLQALAHPEGSRLYPRAPEPVLADVQDLEAGGQRRQCPQLVFWKDQILQLRQQPEGVIINGGDRIAGKVDPLQFCCGAWGRTQRDMGPTMFPHSCWTHLDPAPSLLR